MIKKENDLDWVIHNNHSLLTVVEDRKAKSEVPTDCMVRVVLCTKDASRDNQAPPSQFSKVNTTRSRWNVSRFLASN